MTEPARIFFGYPSRPESRRDTLATAADKIGLSGEVLAVTWEDLQIGGRLIISEILQGIDDSQASVFDITSLNQNVFFELGYAIGADRNVWLVRDSTDEYAERAWKRFGLLRTVGHEKYANSDHIVGAFERDRPYRRTKTLFQDLIAPTLAMASPTSLFYVKSLHDTDPSRTLTRVIGEATDDKFTVVVADPTESGFQPLSWHAGQIFNTRAAIVHLTGQGRRDADIHNARCALIAGLAVGMGKPTLMLAEADYSPPIDYEDLLHVYHNAKGCGRRATDWLASTLETAKSSTTHDLPTRATVLASALKSLRLGSHIAEDEQDTLADYFVETRSFLEAMGGATTVFVGRKGAGKTANLLRAADELRADKRNLVCVIKPPGYELDGILRLLRNYAEKDSKGYLVESLWKFLLFTEVARAAVEESRRRVAPEPGSPMWRLAEMVDDADGLAHHDFAVRIERAVESLLQASESPMTLEAERVAIAESLHQGALKDLRETLGAALSGKRRVAILIDNLDKSWERGSDLDGLAFFLLGLLGSIREVSSEFGKHDRWREPVSVSLAVFLRSDIYVHVARVARERDKLPVRELLWEDPELLLRVVEDRYAASRGAQSDSAGSVWDYFPRNVGDRPTREWIIERIVPRPRDLVYLCNAAITNAVNRGHALVEEHDLQDAEADYSHFALDSILVEGEVSLPGLENVLYQFAGAPAILQEEDLEALLRSASETNGREAQFLSVLRDLAFIGVEVHEGVFDYPKNLEDRKRADALASRFAAMRGGGHRYMVYPAYHAYLEIRQDREAA